MKHELTDKEWELIEAIRNYKKSYPRGKKELSWYIQQVLNELLSRED